MKSYIITLTNYPWSVAMAKRAWMSGQEHGWDTELFSGIDGQLISVDDMHKRFGVTVCRINRKCEEMLINLPGVRGCFLSHWRLWNSCRDTGEVIGIFEHDVLFRGAPKFVWPRQLLKLEGFDLKPPRPAGAWYEGARAYVLTPDGADRLITWVEKNGCLPADVAIGVNVVDIEFDRNNLIDLQVSHDTKGSKHTNSFTWNLTGMARK